MEIRFNNKHGEKITIIDDEDYHLIDGKLLLIRGAGYVGVKDKVTKEQSYLHRIVMGAKRGDEIDHKNRNKLDNRKENLRFVNRKQNNQNIGHRSGRQFVGVDWVKKDKRWRCRVHTKNGIVSKYFKTQIEAAMERDRIAAEEYGEFAVLNFQNSP